MTPMCVTAVNHDLDAYRVRSVVEAVVPREDVGSRIAVVTYDPDPVADASENYSAYTMRCSLAGVEPGLDATQFAVYKYVTA